MVSGKIGFGEYLHQLRTAKGFSQKIVADKLGIDISMLSKIEHGERHVQKHMLIGISEIFELDLKKLQFDFLKNKIELEFSQDPYFKDVVVEIANKNIKKHKR